jgi:hypothetical protein
MTTKPDTTKLDEVRTFMRRQKLTADDLVEIGGQDMQLPRMARRAKNVEKCWELMARSGVSHQQLFPDWTPRAVPFARLKTTWRPGNFEKLSKIKGLRGIDYPILSH